MRREPLVSPKSNQNKLGIFFFFFNVYSGLKKNIYIGIGDTDSIPTVCVRPKHERGMTACLGQNPVDLNTILTGVEGWFSG